MAQKGKKGFPSPNLPNSSACDSRMDDFGSGSTLVKTWSQVCIETDALGDDLSTGISKITQCPSGWNSLWHRVVAVMIGSDNRIIGSGDDQDVSSVPAEVSFGSLEPLNPAKGTDGVHSYQKSLDESDIEAVTTFARR